jgi:TatD DNase family protein
VIDTHCHLTFPDFENRVDEVLADAAEAGVHTVVTIATTTADIPRVLELAESHPNVWAAAGVHPLYSHEGPHDWALLERTLAHPRVVAWGEMGLDNHYKEPPKATQRDALEHQLDLIRRLTPENGKPIVLHCRDAFDELIPILAESGIDAERFVFHCFTGSEHDMRHLLEFGANVSFTGVVTYQNAPEVRTAAALAPLDRFMVETDAPFLTPAPHRGVRPNEPKYVVHVAQTLADLHGLDLADMERLLDSNARRIYRLGPVPTEVR